MFLIFDTHSYCDLGDECIFEDGSSILNTIEPRYWNTDGSFTTANSNSFLSPYEILPIAQENKYWRIFSYFIMKLYVVCTH